MNLESGVVIVRYKERSFRIYFNCKNCNTPVRAKVEVEEVLESQATFFVKDNSTSRITDIESLVLKAVATSFMFYTNDLLYVIKDFHKFVCDDKEEFMNKVFLPGQTSTFISAIKNPNNINQIKETISLIRKKMR